MDDRTAVQHPCKNGAVILCNLSASNEVIGKNEYRKLLVTSQSGRCIAAYVYTSSGVGESTTDLVFGGQAYIAEYGKIVAMNRRFERKSQLIMQDIDIKRLFNERMSSTLFSQPDLAFPARTVEMSPVSFELQDLLRKIEKHPFVPSDIDECNERCGEIFSIQAAGLSKRMTHTGIKKQILGVSGGLDSTLALLVAARTMDMLGLPRKNIIAVTMPGFGTTVKTYDNASKLINVMGADFRKIDIKAACLQHFRDIGHDTGVHDVTYENVQARERTQILMDMANKEGALVVGTGICPSWRWDGAHITVITCQCTR